MVSAPHGTVFAQSLPNRFGNHLNDTISDTNRTGECRILGYRRLSDVISTLSRFEKLVEKPRNAFADTMLSKPQQRYLCDIVDGERNTASRVYNGRARTVIEALVAKGLIEAHFDMVDRTKGNGIQLVERITPRSTETGRRMVAELMEAARGAYVLYQQAGKFLVARLVSPGGRIFCQIDRTGRVERLNRVHVQGVFDTEEQAFLARAAAEYQLPDIMAAKTAIKAAAGYRALD